MIIVAKKNCTKIPFSCTQPSIMVTRLDYSFYADDDGSAVLEM